MVPKIKIWHHFAQLNSILENISMLWFVGKNYFYENMEPEFKKRMIFVEKCLSVIYGGFPIGLDGTQLEIWGMGV